MKYKPVEDSLVSYNSDCFNTWFT